MSHARLHAKVIYGLKTNIDGNANFLTDNDVLYPVGNVLTIHNFSQRRQRFLYLPDNYQVNIISVAPTKKYVALCQIGEKPLISIYDLSSLKRKKTLGIPYDAPGVTKFSCIAFSFDSRYLAAITGEPDQTMLYYVWEKGKVESSIRLVNPQNSLSSMFLLSCNPGDVSIVAAAGNYTFKFLTVSETVWRPYGFAKADNLLISSLCWLNTDRLLAGIKDGRIFYMENGELKNIYKIETTMLMNLKVREDFIIQPTVSQTTLPGRSNEELLWDQEIGCLIAFSKGFAFGYGIKRVVVFEKESQHKYVKRHIFTVPDQVSQESRGELYKINFISINPNYDCLIVTTNWPQLFTAKLFESDPGDDVEMQEFTIMGHSLHNGQIGRISMCAWKTVFMTYGSVDQSVRLWDYETESLVMMKQYTEDIFSVSIHPIGLYCLIGFSDKLRFLTILMDDLRSTAEFSIRNCKTVDFSHGGHLFAAVDGSIIQVYSTIRLTNRFRLKGHTGQINDLKWSQTDLRLISIGTESAIYIWNVDDGSRLSEIILKDVTINAVAISVQESVVYCIANDNKLREFKGNTIVHEFGAPGVEMSLMLINQTDTFIFLTCPGGKICSVNVPLQDPLEFQAYQLHSDDITDISLSFNQQIIISAAKDGSLAFWKVLGDGIADTAKYIYTDEILIGIRELDGKVRTIDELNLRLKELETEHSYKVRQIDVQNNEKLRDVHRGYCDAIEELKCRIEEIQEERMNELNNINVEIVRMKIEHEKTVQDMENNYNAKLIGEYDKLVELEEQTNATGELYESEMKKFKLEMAQELVVTGDKFNGQIVQKDNEIEDLQEEMSYLGQENERIRLAMEEDFDQEVIELRSNYEKQLYDERQDNFKLKGEAGMMRNRFEAAQKDINDLRRQVTNLRKDHTRYQKNVQLLEREVIDLKNVIDDRNTTIQDKDKKIQDLESKNEELEKVKFVLNYKIDELKGVIEPKNQEITELKMKIKDMEVELMNMQKVNTNLEVKIGDFKDKLTGIKHELDSEMKKERRTQLIIHKIRSELTDTIDVIQDPKALKLAVRKLYQRYGADDKFLQSHTSDLDLQSEFYKQRDQLERTVASLRKQVIRKN